ncbi:uncharacterized protein [Nicotiana sylvestris]|uniref:uncharacterized protein n=1 Tax=Nicotiana sylvestris TaxID=4096 RepID=UPI00388C87E7
MSGLSADLVVHKLPTYPGFPPVQQNQRKFKTDMNDKIKEEIMKQLSTNVVRAVRYTTWVANVVTVLKKDGKTRVCVDYRDLDKASPKDNFPLPNIHILVDNCTKHEIQSFVDCFAGYHQILMDEDDAEKTAFTTPWEIEVYVDDVIIKSKTQADHVCDLKKFFERLCRYDLKLNPVKYASGVPSGNLLGFIVSRRGIELDPSKIKSIRDLPPPKNKKEVMSLLGRLNYISRFISQLTTTCEPIFKLLKKDVAVRWIDDCQKAFDRIKDYLSKPPVLVPPKPCRPLFLYLSVMDNSFGCVLGQHDATGRKEQALADHLAENPVDNEYMPLSTYFSDEEVNSIEEVVRDDHPVWKIYFDGAVNIKRVGIGEILISPIGHHYPATARLRFFCTNNTAEYEACIMGLKMAIDLDVHELLVMGDSNLLIQQVQGKWETRDIKLISYRQCVRDLSKRFKSIEFRYIPRFHNELADALATLASMLPYLGNTHIDPLEIQVQNQHGYCNTIETEPYGEPWYHDIKQFLKTREYPEHAKGDQKRTIRRLASGFFLNGEILYKRTPDLNLLRCIDATEAERIMSEVHSGWVEAVTFKAVTKKAVVDFVHFNIICCFGIPKTIITDNAANLNSHLMKEILRKMIQGSRQWYEKLPFALLGYRTTVRTSVGATSYLLAYGTEVVIPAEVEIPSLRIIVESKIEDTEWVKTRLEKLMLINEKRLATVCFGQLYQQRMARAYNKKVHPRQFEHASLLFTPPISEA